MPQKYWFHTSYFKRELSKSWSWQTIRLLEETAEERMKKIK